MAEIDFETYSEAGYIFQDSKWRSISLSPPHGLAAVGAAVYAEHPSTEILSLAYNLGNGDCLWLPSMPPPIELFNYIKSGGLLEAWNSQFEYYIWQYVCHKRMGWPELPFYQLRDAMAKAKAFALPGGLANAAYVLNASEQKDASGKRLLAKFSKPRNPTVNDPRLRITPAEDPADAELLYKYNIQDIRTEASVSAAIPELSSSELQIWLIDQTINYRGVHIDREILQNFIKIVENATIKYTAELKQLTNGAVNSASEIQKIRNWLTSREINLPSLTADTVTQLLKQTLPTDIRRVLEIRASLSASSVKKLYSINKRLTSDGRLHGLFAYCGADRTGRFAGRGPQPQNLPNGGLKISRCECGRTYAAMLDTCPWCKTSESFSDKLAWNIQAIDDCVELAPRGLAAIESVYPDAIGAISGCLRSLFCAAPGADLICSDYSAIEAVILAELAGETWRQEVFRTHGKIYEMSASKITGIPFDQITPELRKMGKVAELASGYQGSVGAWKKFGADKYFNSDEEILVAVKNWRKQSPAIVNFWYQIEDAAKMAIQNPGQAYTYRNIVYQTDINCNILYCRLLSGRTLVYHTPRLIHECSPTGKTHLKITYMGWANIGGWVIHDTYGGKLTENIIQATARDILCHAMVNLEQAGYPIVLHVHDEIVAEVIENTGSITHFENIMSQMPDWALGWPIFAKNGWRAKRYRK